MKKTSLTSAFTSFMEFPEYALSDIPIIEIVENRSVTVTGTVTIIEYSTDVVILSFKKKKIRFVGENLSISDFAGGRIHINGKLETISFE